MWTNLPNLLTLSRILCIPIFVFCYYLPVTWANIMACSVFVLGALTDAFDGYMARKFGQTSALGAFLDPVADKLLVAIVLIVLLEANPSLWLALPAAIIIGREIMVSALREWMAEIGKRGIVKVSKLGKLKTIAQMTALGMLIYAEKFYGIPIFQVGMCLLYISTLLTLLSMYHYLKVALGTLTS